MQDLVGNFKIIKQTEEENNIEIKNNIEEKNITINNTINPGITSNNNIEKSNIPQAKDNTISAIPIPKTGSGFDLMYIKLELYFQPKQ